MPDTWQRTPFGGSSPATSRWKRADVQTTRQGSTPSAKACRGP